MKGAARPRLPAVTRPAAAGTVVLSTVVAAGAALGAYKALRRYPPAGEKTWARTNHRGEPLTLLEGPAVTVGAVAAQLIAAAVAAPARARQLAAADHPERARPSAYPLALAGLGGVTFGLIDDLRGSGKRRGLRGHLGALAHGEVTTGTVKLAGLAATGVAAALLEGGGPADVAVNAGLVAGGANLLNLFDLRPGRAIKVATLTAALVAGGGALTEGTVFTEGTVLTGDAGPGSSRLAGLRAVAAPAGAALALLPEDLGERAMLGDAGANALGAMLGAAAAQTLPRSARVGLLATIVALTAASEKVSFTKVIAATPPLHWLDMLGRRPAPLSAPVGASPLSASTGWAGTGSASTAPAGPVPAGPVPAGPVPASPVPASPVPASPVPASLVPAGAGSAGPLPGAAAGAAHAAGEPEGLSRAERLAWWLRRRRPGRHRRTRAER